MNTYAIVQDGVVTKYPVTLSSHSLGIGEVILPCVASPPPPATETQIAMPSFAIGVDKVCIVYTVRDLTLEEFLEKIRPYIQRDRRKVYAGYVPGTIAYMYLQRLIETGIRSRLGAYARRHGFPSLEDMQSGIHAADQLRRQTAEMAMSWSRTVWNNYYTYYRCLVSGTVRYPSSAGEVFSSIGLPAY